MDAGKGIVCTLMLMLTLSGLAAQESVYPDFSQLQGTFWVERGYQFVGNVPLEDQNLRERNSSEYVRELLELSRQWFSGIIYGYDFYYRPLDRTRQIDEIFTLEPVHQLPWGNAGLEYRGYVEEDERILMTFRYFTQDHERSRLRAWRSSSFPNSSGSADVVDTFTLQSRMDSFQEAVKQAIRGHFRGITLNKPKEITGRIVLFEVPRSFSNASRLHTSVKITIDTDSLVAHQQY